jgi:hypothetical protein
MKKNFRQIVRCVGLISILAFASSCKEDVEEGWDSPYVYVESYIPYYVEPDSLVSKFGMWLDSVPGVGIRVKGKSIDQNRTSDKAQYEALAKKYGDVGFNRKAAIGRDGAISVAIDSISVISDADIDASHPKGTELSDIVKLYSKNYYTYIKSGYKDEIAESDGEHYKFISEYTKEDFSLMYCKQGLEFLFDSTIVVKGIHNLTITIYFENGKILSATQSINFD